MVAMQLDQKMIKYFITTGIAGNLAFWFVISRSMICATKIKIHTDTQTDTRTHKHRLAILLAQPVKLKTFIKTLIKRRYLKL